ncbi:MAG: peroxiredoxin-like family protein [Gammaproteobacteria bacterium]|nr:peroxiredoxin-like family protein [Gammaproteobacteria bacterium]
MPTLRETIDAYKEGISKALPAATFATMNKSTIELKATGIENRALKAGDTMPDFELPNQNGEMRRLSTYLAESAVVLSLYRGGWCPYCNMEMRSLHGALPEIMARGARLVGLTPELPDKAQLTAARNEIAIDILSDAGNLVSEQLGLVFELPDALRPIYEQFGIDLPAYNGDSSFRLPVPATFIIRRDKVVAHAFVNADYTIRMEPAEIVAKLDELKLR